MSDWCEVALVITVVLIGDRKVVHVACEIRYLNMHFPPSFGPKFCEDFLKLDYLFALQRLLCISKHTIIDIVKVSKCQPGITESLISHLHRHGIPGPV